MSWGSSMDTVNGDMVDGKQQQQRRVCVCVCVCVCAREHGRRPEDAATKLWK